MEEQKADLCQLHEVREYSMQVAEFCLRKKNGAYDFFQNNL